MLPTGINEPVLKEKQVIGAGIRKATCPVCHSTDRDRLLLVYLMEHTDLLSSEGMRKRVLHVAPEPNLSQLLLKNERLEYVCGDRYEKGYGYPFYTNIDIVSLPFSDNEFDFILCNHVLEHVANDGEAISELYRVLKKGGKAILQVPVSANSETTFEDWSQRLVSSV